MNNEDVEFTPAIRYLVKPNDCIGWYAAGAEVVGYKDGGNRATGWYQAAAGVNTATDENWSAASSESMEWGIGAEVVASTYPTFSGTDVGAIDNGAAINDPVGTVTFTDADNADELELAMSDTLFDITDNGDGTATVIVKASLTGESGPRTLTITAEDLCEQTVTGTVTVTIINTPPQLSGLSSSTSTPEGITSEVILSTFTCSDSSGIADVSISVSPANVPPFFFTNLTGAATNEYGIYARSQVNESLGQFNYYSQRDYTITVVCDDRLDFVSGNITVNLLPNAPPVINNLPATGTLITVDTSTPPDTVVFTVDFTDPEDNTVTVTFTADPSDCPFDVLDSGHVTVLNTITTYNTSSTCDILVGVADKRNPGISRTLSIILSTTTTVATTTTTTSNYPDRYKTFFDDIRNIIWFVLLMVLLAITAVVTLFVCCNYVCMPCCCKCPCVGGKRSYGWRPRHIEREYTPPPRKPKPKRPNNPQLLSVRRPPPPVHTWKSGADRY
ncbi:serine-rich adhesin for platelets-like [Mercenaria mercenaria]|uniref:serine-rich adhesin for platelets-like n=1 Tax=Mercenaria mercenaria TaxID=6596 RepID=UPI00234F7086|nr:serine-rich adhesin for platelets-like [Mercenaria mercenaria]